jgi:carbonic anhydrase/acetyltransferase-like protein (isoleucine patch superfamily)
VPNSQVVVIAVQDGLTIAAMAEPLIVTVAGHTPQLDPESWVAPNASLIGQVRLAARAGVWYSATLRAEAEVIEIGAGTNIQDGVTVHVDPGFPAHVGAGVSVGHNAVLHGCTIGDGVLVGMGAIVLNAAVIGEGSLVAAGALITQGMVVPPRSLVAGVPGKVRRELSAEEVAANRHNAAVYEQLIDLHRGARQA